MWERQRRTFEETAERYDLYRPTYPDALFHTLRTYADLAADDAILEIGCGTGQATRVLATWGNRLVALEPAPAMADLARLNLAACDNVEVVTTTFEEAEIARGLFGLVASAQAFHWIDPTMRYERVAHALYAHGTLGLLWNTQITPPTHRAFFERVQHVYREHAPDLAHKGEFRTDVDDEAASEIHDSGLFEDVEAHRFPWEWSLTTEDYVGLMSTHSPHAALPTDARTPLLEGIADLIDAEFGGSVTEHYIAQLFVARRR